jgi:glycosyltransferase involved in cell wall biosynthesis
LVRGRSDIKLLLIGSGATKHALVRAAEKQGLTNIVFRDAIPKTTLIPLLKGGAAGLQLLKNVPAFYDGTSPNKFFDYLAAELPVIVNYPGWIADLVSEAACGLVVPPDDPIAFANALEAAAGMGEEWKQKRMGSALLASRFDRDILGRSFVKVLEEAYADRGTARSRSAVTSA